MNILILSWRDIRYPLAGGAEQVINEHAKGWIAAGHQVTHFSSRFKGSKKYEIMDGIEMVRRGYQYYLGVQLAGFWYYLINKGKFDLVVDEFHGMPFFTPLYVKVPKLAVLQEVAREVWFLNPLPRPLNWVIGAVGYLIEPIVFLLYRNVHFMTGSDSAKEDASKFGIPLKNITVVPHGVIAPRLQVTRSTSSGQAGYRLQVRKKKTITYLGVLSKDKGIEDALNCFKILDGFEKFNFWVIGKPETKDYGEKIKKLTRQLGLEKKVRFWGFVSQEKKFELLSKSFCLINPSVHEGWGLVNIEANSVGTPVVSYNSAGLIDSVKDDTSGILCKQNSQDEMAKLVFKILNEQKKYESLQKGAISWSKNFNWQKSRKLSLKLIERIMNER